MRNGKAGFNNQDVLRLKMQNTLLEFDIEQIGLKCRDIINENFIILRRTAPLQRTNPHLIAVNIIGYPP